MGMHLRWVFTGWDYGRGLRTDGSEAPHWHPQLAGFGDIGTGEVPEVHTIYPTASDRPQTFGGRTESRITHQYTLGPRWFIDLKIPPADTDLFKSQDRLAAWINAERRWFAVHVVTNIDNYKMPLATVGLREWGHLKDWWLTDKPSYVANLRRPVPDNRYAAPRDIAAGAAAFYEAGPGLTLLGDEQADGAWRVVGVAG
jgi:hypothetical protein